MRVDYMSSIPGVPPWLRATELEHFMSTPAINLLVTRKSGSTMRRRDCEAETAVAVLSGTQHCSLVWRFPCRPSTIEHRPNRGQISGRAVCFTRSQCIQTLSSVDHATVETDFSTAALSTPDLRITDFTTAVLL